MTESSPGAMAAGSRLKSMARKRRDGCFEVWLVLVGIASHVGCTGGRNPSDGLGPPTMRIVAPEAGSTVSTVEVDVE